MTVAWDRDGGESYGIGAIAAGLWVYDTFIFSAVFFGPCGVLEKKLMAGKKTTNTRRGYARITITNNTPNPILVCRLTLTPHTLLLPTQGKTTTNNMEEDCSKHQQHNTQTSHAQYVPAQTTAPKENTNSSQVW